MKEDADSLLGKLVELLEGLKKNKVSFQEFRKWIYNSDLIDHIGLNRTSLSTLMTSLRKSSSDEKILSPIDIGLANRFIKAYNLFCEQGSFLGDISLGKERNFFGTSWYLYFFYYESNQRQPYLARIVLIIKSNGEIWLKNIPDGMSENYEGKFTLYNSEIGIFELRSIEKPGKKVFIQATLGVKPKEISLGAYLTYESGRIVSGSLVFELVKDKEKPLLDAKILSNHLYPDEFNSISPSIKQFLSRRSENIIRLPREITSKNQLGKLINNYRTNKRSLFFNEEKPIVFISSPTNSIPEDVYEKNRGLLLKLKKDVQESIPRVSVVYAGEKRRSIIEKTTFLDNLELFKRTQFFVFIHTEPEATSSSIVELSWALVYCKVVLVFYKEGTIPELLTHLNNSRRLSYFMNREIVDLENDLEKITKRVIIEVLDKLRYDESL